MKTAHVGLVLLAATLLLAACDKPASDRTGRLLTMAGEEAANIPNKLDRFSRQLNIADTQLRTDRKEDAAKTLALARDTLKESKTVDFDDFHRIAGWTAISQLSRQAGDRDLALQTSDLALAALNDVQPATERPQYVLSLAGELAELRGKEAAVELVSSGGNWAAMIMDPAARRTALVAFTERLLGYEAYEGARTMLRHDNDAAWRTDVFLSLANPSPTVVADVAYARQMGGTGGRGGMGGMLPATPMAAEAYTASPVPATKPFGKDVRFENVYRQSGGR
jgi:hypothetical protein